MYKQSFDFQLFFIVRLCHFEPQKLLWFQTSFSQFTELNMHKNLIYSVTTQYTSWDWLAQSGERLPADPSVIQQMRSLCAPGRKNILPQFFELLSVECNTWSLKSGIYNILADQKGT